MALRISKFSLAYPIDIISDRYVTETPTLVSAFTVARFETLADDINDRLRMKYVREDSGHCYLLRSDIELRYTKTAAWKKVLLTREAKKWLSAGRDVVATSNDVDYPNALLTLDKDGTLLCRTIGPPCTYDMDDSTIKNLTIGERVDRSAFEVLMGPSTIVDGVFYIREFYMNLYYGRMSSAIESLKLSNNTTEFIDLCDLLLADINAAIGFRNAARVLSEADIQYDSDVTAYFDVTPGTISGSIDAATQQSVQILTGGAAQIVDNYVVNAVKRYICVS